MFKKNKPINKTELSLKKIEIVLKSLEKGSSITKACESADLTRHVFYEWKNQSVENQKRFDEIIDSRTLVVEDSLFKSAMEGNVTAQIFWLVNRAPYRWKHKSEQEVKIKEEMSSDQVMERVKDVLGLSITNPN